MQNTRETGPPLTQRDAGIDDRAAQDSPSAMAEGSDVSIPRRNGTTMRGFLALPKATAITPGVVVIHEIMGLNDDMRRIVRRFADSGYAALAPDLFDHPGARALCIAKSMMSVRSGKGAPFDDIAAARDFLGARPAVDPERLGITGFCMGGSFALLAALRTPYRVAAPYYAEVPKEPSALAGICPVVAGYGGRDVVFAPKGAQLRRHLETLSVPHDVKIYPEAGHSYMSHHEQTLLVRLAGKGPMKAGYVDSAAEDSWTRMLAFFGKHLRGHSRG